MTRPSETPLTDRELAWVEAAAGREPGSVLVRLVAEVRRLRGALQAVEALCDEHAGPNTLWAVEVRAAVRGEADRG